MTDFQRKRVYEAEYVLRGLFTRATASENPVVTVAGITVTLPPEANFGSLESIQAYVDRVLAHPAVLARYPWVEGNRITVRRRRGATKAHYERGPRVIAIPDQVNWAMREVVVLHEIAHHLSWDGHGPGFADAFVTLLDAVMGPEAALMLRIAYDDGGVQVGNKTPARAV